MRRTAGFRLLYLLGAFLLVTQAAEFLLGILPARGSDVSWRFGVVGLAIARTGPILVADGLIGIAAFGLEHRGFLRVWAVLHLLAGLVLLLVLGGFTLDLLTVRKLAPSASVAAVQVSGIKALAVGLLDALFLLIAGWRGLQVTKPEKRSAKAAVMVGADQ